LKNSRALIDEPEFSALQAEMKKNNHFSKLGNQSLCEHQSWCNFEQLPQSTH
jgi:hypothetical protein